MTPDLNDFSSRQTAQVMLHSMIPVLDHFHEGVMITDIEGHIIYLNTAQAVIDDLDPKKSLGRKVTDLYRVDEGLSPTMRCLKTGMPVDNEVCYYRTHLGKIINSIHNVYPLFDEHKVIQGTICFIREYNTLDRTVGDGALRTRALDLQRFNMVDTRRDQPLRDNGTRYAFDDIIGTSPDFTQAVNVARMASTSPSPILLGGETGTGKELFAQSIHNHSHRRNAQYVAINCAAIPENLLEGILFGTAKGAFTGSMDKAGIFEKAHGGTLLLDEINSLSMGLQAKLLRVLQEKQVRRVGSLNEIAVDFKLISSTNEDLEEACRQGRFRMDLLYRLGVVFIVIPPLRERTSDLEHLIAHFLNKCNQQMDKEVNTIAADVMEQFHQYHWPGNVRELEHVIEGALNMVGSRETITRNHLTSQLGSFSESFQNTRSTTDTRSRTETDNHPPGRLNFVFPKPPMAGGAPRKTLSQIQVDNEKETICKALTQTRGNGAKAARRLSISPQLLHYKMKKYHINRLDFKP